MIKASSSNKACTITIELDEKVEFVELFISFVSYGALVSSAEIRSMHWDYYRCDIAILSFMHYPVGWVCRCANSF